MAQAIFDISPELSLGELLHRLRVMREGGVLEDYNFHDPDLNHAVPQLKVSASSAGIDEVAELTEDEPRLVASRVCDSCLERAARGRVCDRIGEELLEFSLCPDCVSNGKDARLTDEQLGLIPRVVERWTRVGLSTEPADRPAAEGALERAYRSAGLRAPDSVVWLGSPLAGALVASAVLALQGNLGGPRRTRLPPLADWASEIGDFLKGDLSGHGTGRYVEMSVKARTGPLLLSQASARVLTPLWDKLWRQVWCATSYFHDTALCIAPELHDRRVMPRDAAMEELASGAWESFCRQAGEGLGVPAEDRSWPAVGQKAWSDPDEEGRRPGWWSGLGPDGIPGYALGDYLEQIGLEEAAALSAGGALAATCGEWWPFERLAILTERPTRIWLDAEGRLHRDNGPAIEYLDGYSVKAQHGKRRAPVCVRHYPRKPGTYWIGRPEQD